MSNIYVVGFPKSGNTWLVRLLARALKAEVKKYPMDGITPDIAADINNEILIKSKHKITKTHFTPDDFFKTYNIKNIHKIVYIKRDILDVLISSFFYFYYRGNERYILKKPSLEIIYNPLYTYRYLKGRNTLSRYIKDFCIEGHKNHGKWKNHINLWSDFLKQNKSIRSCTTSYESLINDTKIELINILTDLGFKNIDRDTIRKTVIKESFSERKEKMLLGKKELTFGRDFNIRFLRKGQSNDYKRFLNTRQINYINNFSGKVF
jgi:sulfotransferase family protein